MHSLRHESGILMGWETAATSAAPPLKDLSWPSMRIPSPGWIEALVLLLLSLFVFILATDLRIADDKSIAMRLGYLCLAVGIMGVVKRHSAVVPTPGLWCLLGFLLWSSCTLAWAQYPDDAQQKIVSYWLLFAVTVMIPQYAWNPRVRARLMDAYLMGCYLGIIGIAVHVALGIDYSSAPEMVGRYSFGTDPNYLALALVIGIPFALYRATQARAWSYRAMLLLYVPAALVGVFLTGSRGALLAIAAAVIVHALFMPRNARLLLGAGVLLCLLTLWFFPQLLPDRFTTIPDEVRYGTLSGRTDLWDTGIAVVKEHPLEGMGAGAATGTLQIAAHNTPLELMMEGGVVGVALFYGAILLGIRGAWKSDRRESSAMMAAWAAWAVGGLALSWEGDTITWFLFALLFAAGTPQAARRRFVEGDALACSEQAELEVR